MLPDLDQLMEPNFFKFWSLFGACLEPNLKLLFFGAGGGGGGGL